MPELEPAGTGSDDDNTSYCEPPSILNDEPGDVIVHVPANDSTLSIDGANVNVNADATIAEEPSFISVKSDDSALNNQSDASNNEVEAEYDNVDAVGTSTADNHDNAGHSGFRTRDDSDNDAHSSSNDGNNRDASNLVFERLVPVRQFMPRKLISKSQHSPGHDALVWSWKRPCVNGLDVVVIGDSSVRQFGNKNYRINGYGIFSFG